jgi:membrane protease YdiL (CAAX protease family)
LIAPVPDLLTIAAYTALLISILGLWLPRRIWIAALIVAVVLGYASGVLAGLAVLWIALLAALCVLYRRMKLSPRTARARAGMAAAALGIVILSTLLGMHALPGFHNFRVAQDVVLSPGAAPYTLYLNFDKTSAGLLILGIVFQSLMRAGEEWKHALKRAAPILLLNIVVLMLIALPMGYLKLDPKWTSFFWIWAPVNLFFTCMTEEAFFRGFIQRELSASLASRAGATWIPVCASALLFGLAHFAGGWSYVFLATVAGFGYAWVFQRTQRIEMSILAHFALNAAHFLLLTYPSSAITS